MSETENKEQIAGKLVAVEGLDGSGKSTQVYLLKRWLELDGYKVFFTEWNSSAIVRKATRKGKKRQLLTSTTFSLIHSTDFADRYERQILPLLNAGYIVLADRYVFTAFARDAVRGCDREWIRKLYSFAMKPDVTFYFDVPLKTALSRRSDRYVFTAFARDAVRGCDREWIRKLYSFAMKPDVTFYFDVPLKTALSRIL